MKVRVLLTGPGDAGFSGGIRSFVELLLSGLRESERVQLAFLPVTEGLHDREAWFAKLLRGLRTLPQFWRAVADCDVAHLNSTFDNRSVIRDVLLLGVARLRGRPVLLEFHGGRPSRVRVFRLPLLRQLFRTALASCSGVLLLSRAQEEELHSVLGNTGNTHRVANYIDSHVEGAGIKPEGPMRFLFLARLHADKGVREVVAAARLLAAEGRGFHVTICGDGPERSWVERQVKEPDLRQVVTFEGVVRGAHKDDLLRQSHVLLLPTRHAEGFPIAVLEAMANGLALLASASGAITEIIEADNTGVLVKAGDPAALADAMRQLMVDPERARAMGAAGPLAVAQRYSPSAMRVVFSRLYVAAMERGASHP